ncbi:phosphoribosyltransferase (plasmid) [Gemmatirosa kalamazoonensis]|uniref:Phosphoribosyltransferase n=1 Tax=Gemmatirosa kalamazoonensis TaxID=861299 RepID=W0RT76_9BACT|nr:phosphoribosyltransferase family protein [Gemmatirosa kalamazoonensis]AHG92773.1 phosphoribosyltransferase [Gemmatirosa kalamazoonensis]
MPDASADAFLALVAGRRGHFRLESGHHGALWLDLDPLFADARGVAPFVTALAAAIRPYAPHVVCGPLLGGAFLAQLVARELDAEFAFAERHMPTDSHGMYRAQYRLPPALAARVRGRRVAVVDDVMSAGSAMRGTVAELRAHGAEPVVVGALLVLGDAGAAHFDAQGIPVVSPARSAYALWNPGECPLCAAGAPLEDAAS